MKTQELQVKSNKTIICPHCLYPFRDPHESILDLEADCVEVDCGMCEKVFHVNKRVTFHYESVAPLKTVDESAGEYVVNEDMGVTITALLGKQALIVPLTPEIEIKYRKAREMGVEFWTR